MFRQMIGKFAGRCLHCSHGNAQNNQIGGRDRFSSALTHRAAQPACLCLIAHGGIAVISGRDDVRRALGNRQPDRTSQKAKPDDGNAFDHHALSPAS